MWVEQEDLAHCVAKAREIAEQYKLYVMDGHSSYKSLDDLLWMCQEYLGKKIEIHQYQVTSERSIEGIFLFEEKTNTYHIVVYVHSALLPEHARFIQFKELFHVVLDDTKYRSMDVDEHIEESQSCFATHDSKPSPRVVSEVLAEIAAMEFAFPYTDRVKLRELKDVDYAAIARQYRLPQVQIELFMSDGYMEAFSESE